MRRQLRESGPAGSPPGAPQRSRPPSFTGEAWCLWPNPSWGAAEGNVGWGPGRPVPGAAGCPDSQASRSPISAPALFSQQPLSLGGVDRCPEGPLSKGPCPQCLRLGCPTGVGRASVQRPLPPTRGHLWSAWGGVLGGACRVLRSDGSASEETGSQPEDSGIRTPSSCSPSSRRASRLGLGETGLWGETLLQGVRSVGGGWGECSPGPQWAARARAGSAVW